MTTDLPLNVLLDSYSRHTAERAPALAAALDAEARSLVESGRLARAVRAGEIAPDFELPDGPDGRVRLSDLLRDGPVVLAFYRGRWCSFCTLELRAWQRALPEIRALGARVLAISPQDDHEIAKMRERDRLEFQMVNDADNAIARRYGIAYQIDRADATLRDAYAAAGLADAHGGSGGVPGGAPTLPVPAVYLIDRDRSVAWAHVDPNWRRRAEPAEVVRRLADLGRAPDVATASQLSRTKLGR